jgi:lipoprotein-releasing system ATP-binding protein
LIKVRGLNKSFASGEGAVKVLEGIDLDVSAGEMLAVVGASGVGKSTLLHILGMLERPTTGSVLFENEDVFKLTDRELSKFRNRNIGFIFQLYHLLPEFSVLENAVMPALIMGRPRKAAAAEARELLDELGLSERLDHRPAELSGGEQQRVAIARALMNRPKVVMADEPTGNLDSQTGEVIYKLLRRFNTDRGQTFVVATHNSSLADKMDRILHLVDGKVSQI